jgi:small-conductance mechanosensitive channel/CRP-like cAMP-binding protein
MTHPGGHLLWGLALVAVTVALVAIVRNRAIKRRLTFALVALGGYLVTHGFAWYFAQAGTLDEARFAQLNTLEELFLAFALINAAVALLLNPWFSQRAPDRAPAIVQDAIVVSLFAIVAAFGLGEQAWITSTAVAALVGFALQEQLSNAFAGLAIQVEKPFRVGHWIKVGDFEGRVAEVTWRATKMRTKAGNMVILPNNIVARDPVHNYSEPADPTRSFIDVGIGYEVPPGQVRDALLTALRQVPGILTLPAPDINLRDFGASAIIYRVHFWLDDMEMDEDATAAVRTAVYYELGRRNIEIPWPIQIEYSREEAPKDTPELRRGFAQTVAAVPVFAPLGADAHQAIAATARLQSYGHDEVIVREGEAGDSMFLVRRGEVRVTVGEDRREVAVTKAGGYFGEMSLLTGTPRSATVIARGDVDLLEIDADAFGAWVRTHPEAIEAMAGVAEARRRELDATRGTPEARAAARLSLARRMREFFGL